MRIRTAAIILLMIACLLICGTVLAEGQTNPRRKHVEETIQWKNEKRIAGLFRSGGPTLEITCSKEPTLAEPGIFAVTVINGGDYTDWRFEYGVTDTGRDPNGYIYFSDTTDSGTFDDFVFCTAGEYELDVFLYREDDLRNYAAKLSYPFTVSAMSGYPTLEEKAQEIVNECSVSGNAWQTALNLHDWLTHHTYYDLNYEYYGADVLFRGKGVCDSYSKAFKLLCNTAGITAERVTSRAQNHAWNVIRFGSTWYQVDVTWDDPSGKTEAVSGDEQYAYYCLSDDMMFLDHIRYDISYNPGCPSMEMNYYFKTNTWQLLGKHNSNGDTVMGYFLNEMEQGDASPVFDYLTGDWDYYWPDGDTCFPLAEVQRAIYITGLKQTDWTLDGELLKINIEINHSDWFVTLNAGWDIPETGTLMLPRVTKSIGDNAFEETNATTVMIPDGCTKIGAGAFRNSCVRTMYVPSSVTTVADDAFDGCGRIIFILDVSDSDFADFVRGKGHMAAEP